MHFVRNHQQWIEACSIARSNRLGDLPSILFVVSESLFVAVLRKRLADLYRRSCLNYGLSMNWKSYTVQFAILVLSAIWIYIKVDSSKFEYTRFKD